ncbi:related to potassium transporter TRK-1 [Cephalotrichum gorgonifer]|uniref:Potassium transport protein n=1 Tax=Cephalotrichum gorgonifer TaxID=2041049 RepID=A0AAE8N5A2_9PEZI|nr:related to potassium transporter TRK-1 [Cephalotrichum gorgonifer]
MSTELILTVWFICMAADVWIIFCSLLAFPILYPYGNIKAIDTLFFGCSGSTESGLNTIDVKDLKTYQQVYIYIAPIITNIMFINAVVVVVRLHWFRQRLKETVEKKSTRRVDEDNTLFGDPLKTDTLTLRDANGRVETSVSSTSPHPDSLLSTPPDHAASGVPSSPVPVPQKTTTITFSDAAARTEKPQSDATALRIPSPRDAANGKQIAEVNPEKLDAGQDSDEDPDVIKPVSRTLSGQSRRRRSLHADGPVLQAAKSIERAASSVFVLGDARPRTRSRSRASSQIANMPSLSRSVTLGRNSAFHNMTEADRELLGGIEYRALKLLLRFVFGYFFGLHLLGVICLLPWIHNAPSKYADALKESAIGKTWWAFYSAQTMTDNLGFTLTPDSMVSFNDATWPMLVMTFLAFAGNTCYPICLRFCIWISLKLSRKGSQARESLQFLLDHPRRCYTLLFPSRPTWILFGIIFILNLIDVLLIVLLDLDNAAVNNLPVGPRILAALFQAASSRHTGTSSFNLANVSPAVQFSLLTMMYISIFPIAISMRTSNTFEEQTIGIWESEGSLDESNSKSYIMVHIRNQLSFDLWYIFLGTFLICAVEAKRIMSLEEPSFSVFAVLFEVVSAYGNVGLSLGGPSGSVSMSGHYMPFSKVVICAMMIRGRHRGLPYALDRAITLPTDIVGEAKTSDRYTDAPATEATLPQNKQHDA